MAMQTQPLWVACDVAKDTLVIVTSASDSAITLSNQATAIRAWLKKQAGPVVLAVEATSTYHLELIEQAHARGHVVYVVDGFQLSKYRECVGGRAKTDRTDAQLLLRYLRHEHRALRRWQPPPKGYAQLHTLLKRRAKLAQSKESLKQSMQGMAELKPSVAALLRHFGHLDRLMLKRIRQLLSKLGWAADARRCQGIEGVGPVVSALLVQSFHRAHFRSADAYIAFLGLDVRARDSGQLRGKRKLTKRGDPEARRLLYMAAMTARRATTWAPYYQRMLERGMAPIQALVALGRKIARIAFSLMKNQSDYVPRQPKFA